MGSLEKSNETSEDSELDRAPTNLGDEAIVNPADLAPDEFIQFGSDKRLSFTSRSSSSSSDFSLEDPLQDLYNEQVESSLKLESDDQLSTPHDEKANEKLSGSGTPSSPSNPPPNDSVYQSPPIQVMEHPETPKYRIPSHVFGRKKSVTPGDWGMPSNESLFSIHMGSNSFRNLEELYFQSGELDLYHGVEASMSSPQSNSPYDSEFTSDKTTKKVKSSELDEMGKSNEFSDVKNQGSSMSNNPLNSDNKEDQPSTADARTSHSSGSSSSSSKSFVFPILEGETEKAGTPMRVPKEPKLGPAEPSSKPEESETRAETEKATPFIAWTKWFPCFRYCACC